MSARRWQQEFLASPDPEATLLEHLTALGERPEPIDSRWGPGTPFRLLLAGYSGAGNVGTEMRTGEILRQVRHLLGSEGIEFSALSLSATLPGDALPGVACLPLATGYIPEVVLAATQRHHGTIACEGSMLKSTFANVLSAVMAGALGMAARAGKPSVGYGAEVAAMEPMLEAFVKQQARGALILCRNQPSLETAIRLGLRAAPGTDTGWMAPAAPRECGEALLRAAGWNGSDPVLAICPMNPFWWPVRPSPRMAREMRRSGAHKDRHFASLFFHASSDEIDRWYRAYLTQLALAVGGLCRSRSAFPVIVAMDRVDRQACHDLARLVQSRGAPIIGADHAVGDVVAALRRCDLLVSSRFHALVAAMPAGVPSIGIAMDERIKNLFSASGETARVIAADDPDLGQRVQDAARRLDRAEVERAARRTVAAAIQALGEMGAHFVREFSRIVPDFPLPARPATWHAHLAPLPADVEAFVSDGL
jgi:polysaccharide pyruvyl transferase WcaK-like protein